MQKTIALVGRHDTAGILDVLRGLAAFLRDKGHAPVLEASTAENLDLAELPVLSPDQIGAQADLAIVLGGDGTMLGIAASWPVRRAADRHQPGPAGLHDRHPAGPHDAGAGRASWPASTRLGDARRCWKAASNATARC
jgi:hypothetical protein